MNSCKGIKPLKTKNYQLSTNMAASYRKPPELYESRASEARFFDLINSANGKRGKASQRKESEMNWLFSFMLRFSGVFAAIEKRERRWELISKLVSASQAVNKRKVSELRHKEYVILPLPKHPCVMQMAIGCPDCNGRSRIITVFVDTEITLSKSVRTKKPAVCLTSSDFYRDVSIHGTCLGCGHDLLATLLPTEETA